MYKTIIRAVFIFLGLATISWSFAQETYEDKPYLQDYAEKFSYGNRNFPPATLLQVRSDRNHRIHVLSSTGLLKPWDKYLVKNRLYPFMSDLNILAIETFNNQFIYLTDKAVFSNAWAGKIRIEHDMPGASGFSMSDTSSFMLAGNGKLEYWSNRKKIWEEEIPGAAIRMIFFNQNNGYFLILTETHLYSFDPEKKILKERYTGTDMTAMAVNDGNIIIGTKNGIRSLDGKTFKEISKTNRKLPCPQITCIRNLNGRLWFGSTRGAFALRDDGTYDYYASKRWLVDDHVIDMAAGPGSSTLVLTRTGLSIIHVKPYTLAEKAAYFEQVQRLRHIRYGFQSRTNLYIPGDLSTAYLTDTDNDGLWTSMYLAGELYRYAVTRSEDALENAYEAFEAMERLTAITGIHGFPARTYARDGYQSSDRDPNMPEDQKIWRRTPDGRWRWKSTTSSDESCGHFFVYALFADIVPDPAWRERAIHQIKIEMDHIIDHDWYLVTWNGKPTQWGRWNPDYVNSFSIHTGDRRLNSTLIIAFLQTAYHFTGEEKYREKAYELMDQYGYLENILRPASVIGFVEGVNLSDSWNHSDDEMYFLTVRALIEYAFTDELKKKYLETVKSHWERVRPEKNPLWNFIYAQVGGKDDDLENSIWWLKEFPLDLIAWNVDNTLRKDITLLPPNFMKRTSEEILPPDECPLHLHNSAYIIKGGEGGRREYPPYIYTLPYWLGRYVGAIGPGE